MYVIWLKFCWSYLLPNRRQAIWTNDGEVYQPNQLPVDFNELIPKDGTIKAYKMFTSKPTRRSKYRAIYD